MKRFLLSLFALCLLALPVSADRERSLVDELTSPSFELAAGGFGAGNNLTGFWQTKLAEAGAELSGTFEDCTVTATNGTSYTSSSHDVGTADATRKTLVGVVVWGGGVGIQFTGVTVGGDTATEIFDGGITGSANALGWFIVDNPSGTAEDIVVTVSATSGAFAICSWSILNSDFSYPTGVSVDYGASTEVVDANLDLRSNAFVAGIALGGGADSHTWSGLTESDDATTGETSHYSAATDSFVSAEDNRAISITPGSAVNQVTTITFSNDHANAVVYLTGCPRTTTGATTYTFTDAPFGVPDANRTSIVLIGTEDAATAFNYTSATIGGTGATEDQETGNLALIETAVYHLANAAGDEETLSVVMSEATSAQVACIYAAYNLSSSTPNATNVDPDTGGAETPLDVATDANGIVVVLCMTDVNDTTGFFGVDTNTTDVPNGTLETWNTGSEDQTPAETRNLGCDPGIATTDVAGVAGSWD